MWCLQAQAADHLSAVNDHSDQQLASSLLQTVHALCSDTADTAAAALHIEARVNNTPAVWPRSQQAILDHMFQSETSVEPEHTTQRPSQSDSPPPVGPHFPVPGELQSSLTQPGNLLPSVDDANSCNGSVSTKIVLVWPPCLTCRPNPAAAPAGAMDHINDAFGLDTAADYHSIEVYIGGEAGAYSDVRVVVMCNGEAIADVRVGDELSQGGRVR